MSSKFDRQNVDRLLTTVPQNEYIPRWLRLNAVSDPMLRSNKLRKTEGICANTCILGTSPCTNFLLDESATCNPERTGRLPSSTPDKRSSDLRVEAPRCGHPSRQPKPKTTHDGSTSRPMLTALDIPHHYLRSLVCVGVVGWITSVERGAAAVRRTSGCAWHPSPPTRSRSTVLASRGR